jgi:hypothetical protein
MDMPTVAELVTTALRTAPFRIGGAALQSPAVSTLLTEHLGGDALVLGGAALAGQTDTSITVAGTLAGPLHGLTRLAASARFTVADGVAQVRATLTGLPGGWKPSASFPSLAGTVTDAFSYAEPWLALDSANADALPAGFPAGFGFEPLSPAARAVLVRGLSAGATVTLTDPPPGLGLLAGGVTWAVAGELALLPGLAVTCLATAPAEHPYSIAGYEIPFSVALVVAPVPPGDADPSGSGALPATVSSLMQFEADVEKEVGTTGAPHVIKLPVALRTLPGQAGLLTLGTALPDTVPLSLTELGELVAGQALAGHVPAGSGFPGLDDIVLQDVSLAFAPALPDPLVHVAATVGLAKPDPAGWPVFGGLIVFRGLSVTFTYCPDPSLLIAEVEAEADFAGGTLDASVALPDLTFALELAEDTAIDIKQAVDDIARGSVTMPQITCSQLDVAGDVRAEAYRIQATVTDSWTLDIGGKQYALSSVELELSRDSTGISGQITGTLTVADLDLYASAAYRAATPSWSFTCGTLAPISLDLTQLAVKLGQEFSITFPVEHAPAGLTLDTLVLYYETSSSSSDIEFRGLASFDVAGVPCQLGIAVAHTPGSTAFTGVLFIGEEGFEVDFSQTSQASRLSGKWLADDDAAGLDVMKLITAMGFPLPPVPPDLDLTLTSVQFTYDITRGAFVISADSVHGAATFAAVPVGGTTEYFFGLTVGAIPGLGDLPVVGGALAAALAIEDVMVALSSQPMTAAIVTALDAVIPDGQPRPPQAGTADTVALAVTLDLAGTKLPLSIGMGQPQSTGSNTIVPAPPPGSPVPPATAPGSTDGTTWFNVQRTIGPLTLRRAGARYADGALGLALDASLSAGGLQITLLGLAISSPLSSFRPVLSLDGLGIEFSRPPLAIGGGFARIIPPQGGASWEYGGGGVVSVPEFQLAALGAFADLDGQPSMFVFARLNAELGGPPAFFVTGIAAGFGYNSALRIPAQDQVIAFPLVSGAASAGGLPGGSDPLAALAVLTGGTQPWVSPAQGQIWVAAGVSFTSFDLVQSQALLVAEFGADLVFALIGLSTARFPRTGTQVYAQAQLELEVVLDVGAGSFAATALLAPNSYLLDPACALTGGFAFCFWFGPNPHAGDFVLTLGGYSPYFAAPAWYPAEPRVGFTWHVSSTTVVTGTAYFALTPAAIMAGGELAVNFHDGNLSAWLTAQADVIAWWEPFHFRASVGVSIGASYTFDFLGTSKTITVELGADVDLWGPPTGGTATVHFWILSCRVSFGAGPTDDPGKLEWPGFKALLPAAPLQLAATAGADGEETAKDGTKTWIVRSGSFAFTSRSAVPASAVSFGGAPQLAAAAEGIDILPMQVTGATSQHSVTILHNGAPFPAPCTATPITASGPRAMWGTGGGKTLAAPDEQLVDGLLTGVSVTVDPPALAATPGVISLAGTIGYDTLPQHSPVPVAAGAAPAGPAAQPGTDTIGTIASGISSDPVTGARHDLHNLLSGLGFAVGANAAMTAFAAQARTLFTDEPLLVGS